MQAPDRSNLVSSLVLALILALLVWASATNEQLSRLPNYPSTTPERGIPIELVNLPEGLVIVEGEGQSATVDLLIPDERLGELQPSDLAVQADLAGLEAGTQPVEVSVIRKEAAPPFRILAWEPSRITVQLDQVVTRTVPIEVVVTDPDSVPQSFQVLTPTIQPATVVLTGARSLVEPIERGVVELRVAGARAPVMERARPRFVTEAGRTVTTEELELEPNEVQVTVPIEQRQGYRELIVRPVVQGSPAANYQPGGFTYSPQTVTVVGQPSVVASLNGIVDTEPISVEGLTEGEYIRYVPLELPDSVSTVGEGFVRVSIVIEPRTGSKSVTLEPEVTGVGPGLAVADAGIIPPTVDVFLKGPLIELDELEPNEVAVTLDVAGLEAGTYLIEPRVQPPGSLRAESVIPQQVEVTLVEAPDRLTVTLPIEAVGLPAGTIALIEPYTGTFAVQGTLAALERLQQGGVEAQVDVAGLALGSYVLSPTLPVETGLALTGQQPASVSVTLVEEAALQRVRVPLQLSGVPEGLAATANASTVVVALVGPPDAAARAANGEIVATLSMAGRGPGSYFLRPDVRLPEGYRLVSLFPGYVRVRLDAN